ncbi:phage virion morphogenesis protein [Photobacterium damselae]|uniref:phage virion morphogenesis protein n=1 Tax=Photobacterium damselae TaxID=38293 RepID=UPI002F3E8B6C
MRIEFNQAEIDMAMKAISRLKLSYSQEQLALRRIGREVIKQSKKNIREQNDVDGQSFSPRRKKRKGRRKMLPNIAKRLRTKNDANYVDVGFGNSLTAQIAYKQQYGSPAETWTGDRVRRVRGPAKHNDDPPTYRQARALIRAGYTIPKQRGKGRKKPSTKWVRENITQGRLGLIIRELLNKTPKQSWEIDNEPRAFLGLTPEQSTQIITREILNILR